MVVPDLSPRPSGPQVSGDRPCDGCFFPEELCLVSVDSGRAVHTRPLSPVLVSLWGVLQSRFLGGSARPNFWSAPGSRRPGLRAGRTSRDRAGVTAPRGAGRACRCLPLAAVAGPGRGVGVPASPHRPGSVVQTSRVIYRAAGPQPAQEAQPCRPHYRRVITVWFL